MQRLLLIVLVIVLFSCGSQRHLQKSYVGKPLSILSKDFGNPKAVFNQGDEKVYVFEKITHLKSAEIAQGKLTLDPMITPMVEKTERFYFTVKEGKIVKAKLEEEYER